jgi:hypothetical protein
LVSAGLPWRFAACCFGAFLAFFCSGFWAMLLLRSTLARRLCVGLRVQFAAAVRRLACGPAAETAAQVLTGLHVASCNVHMNRWR